MKTMIVMVMGGVSLLSACATVRTRSSDPVMRIAVDNQSISLGSYARLEKALVDSGKFIVVDRAMGFKAIVHEQEMEHTTTRFGENEKYSLWAKLYGVGGIVVATEQCYQKGSIWGAIYSHCTLNLTLVNATTGEIMAVSEGNDTTRPQIAPEWADTVENLIDTYPKVFASKEDLNQTIKYGDTLKDYRERVVPAHAKKELGMGTNDQIH